MLSRLTSSINHITIYRHLGVLSFSRICGDFFLKNVYSTITGKSFIFGFQKYAPPPPGRQKLAETNNFACITFSKIYSLSVKNRVGKKNCRARTFNLEILINSPLLYFLGQERRTLI